jgi:hypothetical protein
MPSMRALRNTLIWDVTAVQEPRARPASRSSQATGPWGGVTAGKLAGQVLEVVARGRGRLEPAGDVGRDADGERVASDTGEVLAEH